MAPEPSRGNKKNSHDAAAAAPAAGVGRVDPRVLDLDHLARYTIGNRDLEEELLKLFRVQLRTQVTAIAEANDADQWRFATHTLKGVARSIGAWAIADTAQRLEQLGHDGDLGHYGRLLEALEGQIAACEHEIDRVIGRPSRP